MARTGPSARLPRIRDFCAVFAAVVGALTLLGWLTGWRRLAEIRSDYIPMAPNTALGFLLFGAALVVLPREPGGRPRRRAAALVLAAPVAFVAGVRLIEYATGADFRIDRWLNPRPMEMFGLAPIGRMALLTAAGFALAVAALILVGVGGRRRAAVETAAVLALVVGCQGTVFVFGYLYDAPFFYGGHTIPMALNTAFGFVVLGIGLIAAAGPRSRLVRPLTGGSVRARLLRNFLPFVVGVVAFTSWASHGIATAAGGRSAALFTAAATVAALLLGALLCARIAGRVGEQLERAEEALRRINDELEARVADRTRELTLAKDELEARNRELQQAAAELESTATSVRQAHQELQGAYRDLQHAETQLVQAEKLSALGQMVAGVAHEINNPLAFVSNNVAVLQRDVGHLFHVLELYRQAEGTLEVHQRELLARIRDLAEQVDLAYVIDNLNGMMARSREGLKRIEQIVRDLRDFVRLDEGELKRADINAGIRSTVHIIQGLAKDRGVALALALEPLPEVACYPAKLNQVILNLVVNAIDACSVDGRVTVATRATGDGVEIAVADTGHGIDPAIQAKIFDPFFTTKPVGRGTGLGLSISLGIVRAHGGTIHCESAPGQGTRFVVRIPLEVPVPEPAAASA